MRPVLLVHGAWHGAWCWHRVLDGLAARGVTATAVELPLLDGPGADADAVRTALAGLDDAVVMGHSYGGVVISAACAGAANVAHLVYLCAFQLTEDETTASMNAAFPSALLSAIRVDGDTRTIDPDRLTELFYADCPTEDIELARRSLRPMPARPTVLDPFRPAWRDLASTYVVCEQDRAIVPEAQRMMAARAGDVRNWDTSHSPFFSRPDLVIDLLTELASAG
jgi:pimeloyl-ACP methyl ester carboxylesterase